MSLWKKFKCFIGWHDIEILLETPYIYKNGVFLAHEHCKNCNRNFVMDW